MALPSWPKPAAFPLGSIRMVIPHQFELWGVIAPAAGGMGEMLALFETHVPADRWPCLTGSQLWNSLAEWWPSQRCTRTTLRPSANNREATRLLRQHRLAYY
jgi:hypothetical protein